MCVSFIRFCYYVEFHIFVLTNLRQTRFDHLCWCKAVLYIVLSYIVLLVKLFIKLRLVKNSCIKWTRHLVILFNLPLQRVSRPNLPLLNVNLNNLGLGSRCLTGTCYSIDKQECTLPHVFKMKQTTHSSKTSGIQSLFPTQPAWFHFFVEIKCGCVAFVYPLTSFKQWNTWFWVEIQSPTRPNLLMHIRNQGASLAFGTGELSRVKGWFKDGSILRWSLGLVQ